MFIIPRLPGESIVIGDDLLVTVIEVLDDEVRLSVERLTDGSDGGAERVDEDLSDEATRRRPR